MSVETSGAGPAPAQAVDDLPLAPVNVFDPAHRARPFAVYAALREAGPFLRTPLGLMLAPRYEECSAILQDTRWGHGYDDGINPFRPGVDRSRITGSFLTMDPPDHTRLRGLVSKAFTQRSIAALREGITATVDELLDAMIGAGEVDLVTAFAYPVPLTTICRLLGVPVADQGLFRGWSRAISRGLDPDRLLRPDEITAREDAIASFNAYFTDLLDERRRHPGEDLLSELVAVRDRGGELSAAELLDLCILLLIGGHETTGNLISGAVLTLSRHPDQMRLLRDAPQLAAPAIEEVLRYDTPVPFPTRTALVDIELGGVLFPRGTGMISLTGSANRDPEAYPDPERLDIARFAATPPPRRHLAFSHGPHFCLGAPLARFESAIALEGLIRRTRAVTITTDEPPYRADVSLRGVAALPAVLHGR